MIKSTIVEKGDIEIREYGFNVLIHRSECDEIIVQWDAVPDLIEGLQEWWDSQDHEARDEYLLEKYGVVKGDSNGKPV